MTDKPHTPTVDELRRMYALKVPHDQRDRRNAEFDRFLAAAEQRGAIKALRRVAKDLEWLGAQGNIPTPDTSWQGVLECIRIINSEALTIEYRADRIANKEGGE